MMSYRRKPGFRMTAWRRWLSLLLFMAILALSLSLALPLLDWLFPFPVEQLVQQQTAVELTDREGRPIRVLLGGGDSDYRPWYRYNEDDWIVRAIVAVEDRRFWRHDGLDAMAVIRACRQNLLACRVVSGASTLTMQLVRMLEPRPRTLSSKVVETFRARQLEALLSKEDILEQYLNRAPFGSNIVGIEAAARRYFGKEPGELSLAEASLLAGLPQSPERFRPDRFPERARGRRLHVLQGMERCGMISAAERERAAALPVNVRPAAYPFRYPHFADLVIRMLPTASPTAPLRTTVDSFSQEIARDALLRALERHRGDEGLSGAVVILDVHTGSLRALVGSPDYFDDSRAGQFNCALAARSPGSALKPFVYLLAVERGELTPGRIIPDVPRSYGGQEPVNFDGVFNGLVTARDALSLSLNMPALHVAAEVGAGTLHHNLRALGMETVSSAPAHYGLGLALGNAEVRLLDLVNAYACLARSGALLPLRFFEDDCVGDPKPFFSPEAVWLVNDMLSGRQAMEGAGISGRIRAPRLALKTGTSSGHRDAWVIAYNPDYVVGVWIGRPDGRPSPGLIGGRSAAPVALDIFRSLYPQGNGPWFTRPQGIAERSVCARSGQPAGRYCPAVKSDLFIPGVTRHQTCTVHPHPPGNDGEIAEIWPPDVAAFLARSRPRAEPDPDGASSTGPLRISRPASDTVWRRPDSGPAALALEVRGARPGDTVYWFANESFLGSARADELFWWEPQPGQHQLVAADASGSSAQTRLLVE